MLANLAQAGYSAFAVTVQTFFRVGYPRVAAAVNLLRFPIDVLSVPSPRHPTPQTAAALAPVVREQVCPEPEMLAAFIDHSLAPEEQAQAEAHMAHCGACRKTLALTVKSAVRSKHPRPTPPLAIRI